MTMRDIRRGVALSGWLVILITTCGIVASYAYLMVRDGEVSAAFDGTAKLCFGFLFGVCATLVKELVLAPEDAA